MTNCLYCQHWQLSKMATISKELGQQGFAPCQLSKAKATYSAAGWHCQQWAEAPSKVMEIRQRVLLRGFK
jgi:uncharacterized Fe-S radical SAM superfamily protein PflX